jgi:hypothetical protein
MGTDTTETIVKHCPACKAETEHYTYDSLQWAEIVTVCDPCGRETRDAYISPADILREGRRGF